MWNRTPVKYGARREVVLIVQEPSVGRIQLGKIARRFHDGRWMYCNHISAEMRKTGEFAVAPCVVELMRAWGVEGVMYYDPKTKTTFVTNIYTLTSEGRLVSYSYRPRYWHLAIARWNEVTHKVGARWATEELGLEWLNEAENAALQPRMDHTAQMALF